jgi:glycosyl transferase family 25
MEWQMQPFPVYLINLDRSPDRLAFMQAQFVRLGMAFERIPAVDGRGVAADRHNWRHHAPLRDGEVGCYLSHIKALEAFLASGAACGVILEDDAVLSDALPGILAGLQNGSDWDLVKLYATHVSGVWPRRGLVRVAFRHGASAAYVVNRHAAARLLSGLLPITVPYDHAFDRAWTHGFRLRLWLPFPVSRHTLPSTIGVSSKKLHKPWYAQGGMVLFRGWNDVARVAYAIGGA